MVLVLAAGRLETVDFGRVPAVVGRDWLDGRDVVDVGRDDIVEREDVTDADREPAADFVDVDEPELDETEARCLVLEDPADAVL